MLRLCKIFKFLCVYSMIFDVFLHLFLYFFFTNSITLKFIFIQKRGIILCPLKDYFAETKPTDEITSCPASLLMNSNTA